MLLLRNKTEQ